MPKDDHELPYIMTRKQVAKLLNMKIRTIANWAHYENNDFPKPFKIAHNKSVYKRDEILAWLETRRHTLG